MLGTFDVGLFPFTFLADATHSDTRVTCAPSDLSCDTLYASLAAPAAAAAAALAWRTPIAFHDSNIVPVYLCRTHSVNVHRPSNSNRGLHRSRKRPQ